MKRLLGGVFLLLLCSLAFPQKMYELSHEVLVPAGSIVSHTGLSYQQTIGETAVEVSLPSFYNLTQGYQQPRFIPKKVLPDREGNGAEVFPNPLTEASEKGPWIATVRVYGVLARHYIIYIYSLPGSLMYTKELDLNPDHDWKEPVSFANYSKGIYIVHVISTDGVINRSFKIDRL
jgi:hypothetical protein